MLNYLLENLVENLINVALWFFIGWIFFRPSRKAKVVAALLCLVPLASYFGQYSGGQQSTEHWVLTFLSALIGLGLGYFFAPRGRSARSEQDKLTREEMISGLRRMLDDPDTPQEKRDWATDRLRAVEKLKS